MICIFLCLFSLLCYHLFFKKPNCSRRGFDLPLTPPSLPIIGHLHFLLSTPTHKSLLKLSSNYGPLLHLRIFNIPIVTVYAVMRDPDYWEHTTEFKPERFLASSSTKEDMERRDQALKYIPFGGGRRGCPGANLAYLFLGTALGMMVQGFEWRTELDNKINMEEAVVGLSLTMAHPPKLIPIARTTNPLI